MTVPEILKALEAVKTDHTFNTYRKANLGMSFIGTPTQAMKPLAKQLKRNQTLANELFHSGCYEAMYLAGMIADPEVMTEEMFEDWHKVSTHHMVLDWIVAVSLAEMPFGIDLAEKWILCNDVEKQATGWYAYCSLLGYKRDREFSVNRVSALLDMVRRKWSPGPGRLS